MRAVKDAEITRAISELCIAANVNLPADLENLIIRSGELENGELAKGIFKDLQDNMKAAREMNIPICQDTGMAVIFAEIGQEVYIEGGFEQAVNAGVSEGYTRGLLRASVVGDPLRRGNTGDNTPAVIHTRLVPGDKIKLTVAPKGFGSENMSAVKMMNPSADREDVIFFVTDTVIKAGGNPCPPLVIGVGVGGDFELCAMLAKRALCRSVSEQHPDAFYRELEEDILRSVNNTNIGPQGLGGRVTALRVMIEAFPTHIAGLPVAVNIGCHVARHKTCII